ncbi:MAG: toprim domain-containing protein, partial [Nitrospinae bacterium]|nr:toprim domain-containing protein [Nitrospinota bacterium]
GGEGKQPLEYLLKRGMSKESLERFNIGYAGRGGDSLQRYLQQRNIPLDIQDKGGLVRKNESGVGYRDRFKGRIIFPIKNETGQDVGLGGRIIETDSKRPKYLNSPETLVYKKREILYGLDLAKEFIRNEKQVVVVEGYMDLISLFQAEVRNVVATSGTALSPEHVKLLKRYADSAVIIFDGDQAGITAAQKASLMLGDAGIKVRVAVLPKGDDPDTFIKKVGKDGFLGFVEKALPLMEYIVAQSIAGKAVETIDDKVVVVESLIPYLDKLENSVERNHYVHMIADRLSVSEVSIREELEKRRRGSRKKDWLKEDKGSKYPNRAERDLIGLMLADFSSVAKIKDGIGVEEFGDALLREIAEMVYSLSSAGEITVGQLLDNLKSDEAKRLVTEAAVQAVDYQDIGKAIDDCLRDIKRKRENLPGQWKTADSKYERVKVLKEQLKTLKGTDNSKIH